MGLPPGRSVNVANWSDLGSRVDWLVGLGSSYLQSLDFYLPKPILSLKLIYNYCKAIINLISFKLRKGLGKKSNDCRKLEPNPTNRSTRLPKSGQLATLTDLPGGRHNTFYFRHFR